MLRLSETLLELIVHPQKNKFGFSHADEWSSAWHIQVVSVPQKNAANRELVTECTRLFGVPVQLVRGKTSTRKAIRIPLARETVEQVIRKQMNALSNQKKK